MATLGFQPNGESSSGATHKDVISQSLELVENPPQKVHNTQFYYHL